jgi:hypothetical protein
MTVLTIIRQAAAQPGQKSRQKEKNIMGSVSL